MWRKSLPEQLHVDDDTGTKVYYLNGLAVSYRYECSICRLILHSLRRSSYDEWTEWTRRRLRSAILELDIIATRVLASRTFCDFPISLYESLDPMYSAPSTIELLHKSCTSLTGVFSITTMMALLAFHLETALDPTESDLLHNMARVSISQTMLLLSQGKEISAVKRALPLFEKILTKKKLLGLAPEHDLPATQDPRQQDVPMQATTLEDMHRVAEGGSNQRASDVDFVLATSPGLLFQQSGDDVSYDIDLLSSHLFPDWQVGQVWFND